MTDTPRGENWWLASDGRWYPPEAKPGETLPMPPSLMVPTVPRHLSRALTYSTFGALLAAALLYLVYGIATVGYLIDFEPSGATSVANLAQAEPFVAEDLYFIALGIAGLASVGAAVLIVIWGHLAFKVVLSRGATGTTWSPGWAIGAWFIPIGNLILPRLVLGEVDRISHPASGSPPIGDRWKASPRDALGWSWWICFIAAYATNAVSLTVQGFVADDAIFERWVAVEILSAALYVIAGVLGALYVLRVGRRLGPPRPSPALPAPASGYDVRA